jgi:hypothetical protein
MMTTWLRGGGAVLAVGIVVAFGSLTWAQQPTRQPTRQVDGGPNTGGGNRRTTVKMNRERTRRVQGGPVGEPQLNQQTGQYRIQRQVVSPGLRRLPIRPQARWRLGVHTDNAPKGLLITRVSQNSPAARFGLERGDYLLDVMGYPVGFYRHQYYPVAEAFNQLVRPDGWVNLLVWNKRTNADEAMWVRLEPRGGQVIVPFRSSGRSIDNINDDN